MFMVQNMIYRGECVVCTQNTKTAIPPLLGGALHKRPLARLVGGDTQTRFFACRLLVLLTGISITVSADLYTRPPQWYPLLLQFF